MNALYDAESVGLLLGMANSHSIPLLFITNNVANRLLKYEDAGQLAEVSFWVWCA